VKSVFLGFVSSSSSSGIGGRRKEGGKEGRKEGRKEILILWILGRWLGFRLLVCVGKRRGRELWMVSMAKMPQSWEVEEER
jgi:hypothetical protein